MKAREIMTPNPACCTPETPARDVALQMDAWDCGCIPVVSDNGSRRLLGVVTDRDLAVRGLARGGDGETLVRDLMSREVSCCTPETDAKEVERIMAERQVRRVPVVDDDGCCTGMIAQADLARFTEQRALREKELAHVVEAVSQHNADSRADAEIGVIRGVARDM